METCVVLALLGPLHWRRILPSELLLNLATHPLLWFGVLWLPGPYFAKLAMGEAVVFAVELLLGLRLLRGCGPRNRIALAISSANLVTLSMTFVL